LIQKLGWGNFSTVWLAQRLKKPLYVAIKISKSFKKYADMAKEEIDTLQAVQRQVHNARWKKYLKDMGMSQMYPLR